MNLSALLELWPEPYHRAAAASSQLTPLVERSGSLEAALSEPDSVMQLYSRLQPAERGALAAIIRAAGASPCTYEQVAKAAADAALSGCSAPLSRAELQLGFAGLQRKGIIFTFRKAWGERLHTLAADTLSLWVRCALPLPPAYERDDLAAADDGLTELTAQMRTGLLLELLRLLAAAQRDGLPLTQKGALHKRQLQQLEQSLQLESAAFAPLQLKYAQQEAYSPALALVLDAALRLGLLQPAGDRAALALGADALAGWLAQPLAAAARQLYALWAELCRPEPLPLQLALAALEAAPPGRWRPLAPLSGWLAAHGIAPPAQLDAHVQERVRMLAELGFAELGQHPRHGAMMRWAVPLFGGAAERPPDQLLVQPDFELIVPPHVELAVRWELECSAELVRADTVMIYRLTRQSVSRALEQGQSAEQLISFYTRQAKFGLPDNVAAALREWEQQLGQVTFRDVTLLQCRDAETARLIAALPQAAELMADAEAVGERHFIVPQSQAAKLQQLLQQAGYEPRWLAEPAKQDKPDDAGGSRQSKRRAEPLADEEARQAAAAASKPQQGLIYGAPTIAYFEMDSELPSENELHQQLQRLPAAWYKDYREYHLSTKREILLAAIELGAYVQFRLADGRQLLFLPEQASSASSQPERDTFTGWAEGARSTMDVSEWKEMRLVVPATE